MVPIPEVGASVLECRFGGTVASWLAGWLAGWLDTSKLVREGAQKSGRSPHQTYASPLLRLVGVIEISLAPGLRLSTPPPNIMHKLHKFLDKCIRTTQLSRRRLLRVFGLSAVLFAVLIAFTVQVLQTFV